MLNQFTDEMRRLAFTVAPELEANPLYILDSKELERVEYADALAYTLPNIVDFHVRQKLINRNEWRGAGITIVFFPERFTAENIRLQMLQTFLHEIGHNLPAKNWKGSEIEPTPQLLEWQAARHVEEVTAPRKYDLQEIYEEDHNWRFTRRCLHLWYRSRLAGWHIPLDGGLCAGYQYRQSHPSNYLEIMLPELVTMKDATFTEICNLPRGEIYEYFKNDQTYFDAIDQRRNTNENDR